MVCIKRLRCDINEGCDIEMSVTSSEGQIGARGRAARGRERALAAYLSAYVRRVVACAHARPRAARMRQKFPLRVEKKGESTFTYISSSLYQNQ